MYPRPAVGAVGLALDALAPEGQADFYGLKYRVRAERGSNIDPGQSVIVTGFDPDFLMVRVATAEEVASQPPPPAPEPEKRINIGVTVSGYVIFFLGVALLIGNRSGLFPTVPFAGGVLMAFGAGMVAMGMRSGERD